MEPSDTPQSPRLRAARLVSAAQPPPTRWQVMRSQVRAAWRLSVFSRDPRPLFDLAIMAIWSVASRLEGRVYIFDPRGNVSLNWRNPLAPIVAVALMPLGLIVSLGIKVYGLLLGRRT